MNITIPFSKEIPFKGAIAEICSISLEHDISINDKELLGDFIVSGDYKNLDVNVDTYPFSHVVPFTVDLEENLNLETLSYEIEDFNYEIINDDTLKVNILLHVEALKNEEIINEEIFERVDIDDNNLNELIIDEKKEIEKEKSFDDINIISEANLEEDYITYHVHYVKINETIDTISNDYKISKDDLLSLNDVINITPGDKLIIPDINE